MKVIQERERIRKIMNKYRSEPLPENWWPVRVYCEKCKNGDYTEIINYDGETNIEYKCNRCGHTGVMDFSKVGMVKPTWRVDWAMRWYYYNVDFEPSGKDHMVAGSSYDTSSEIVREIFGREPPLAIMYEFVGKKGEKGKMSASKGNIVTATEVLRIYPPEVIKYFFAGTKPSKLFVIPFDEEVLKVYEDFYQCERIYFGVEEVSERDREHWKRVYELSMNEIPDKIPAQIPFSFISLISQLFDEDKNFEKIIDLLRKTGHVNEISEYDEKRIKTLIKKSRNWVNDYAPEKYRIIVQEKIPDEIKNKISESQRKALLKLRDELGKEWTSEEIQNKVYEIGKESGNVREFFQNLYTLLIGKKSGPRAGQFILAIGKEKVMKILGQLR